MLVEDEPASRRPVRDASPHLPVSKEFQGASYQSATTPSASASRTR
nr:PaeR7I family type II restriction endonuclease [Trinickia soli]